MLALRHQRSRLAAVVLQAECRYPNRPLSHRPSSSCHGCACTHRCRQRRSPGGRAGGEPSCCNSCSWTPENENECKEWVRMHSHLRHPQLYGRHRSNPACRAQPTTMWLLRPPTPGRTHMVGLKASLTSYNTLQDLEVQPGGQGPGERDLSAVGRLSGSAQALSTILEWLLESKSRVRQWLPGPLTALRPLPYHIRPPSA